MYARETYRIHLYFGQFWLFCKCFLCVSFVVNAFMKHTGSTYNKWFLCVSYSNTRVTKAQDALTFLTKSQKLLEIAYKNILCFSHSRVWTWNKQDQLTFCSNAHKYVKCTKGIKPVRSITMQTSSIWGQLHLIVEILTSSNLT